jgi:hypothetical protein
MTDSKTPSDFDSSDGWIEDRGIEKCADCGVYFSANGGYTGPVYDQDGTRYETHLDTDPVDAPFFCPDCWAVLDANRRSQLHRSLDAYAEEDAEL